MVLINLLRNQTEENYATNLLCMSDTGKNMERRIGMIKRKTKGTVISICVLVVVILLVVGIVFIKIPNTEKSKTDIGENLDNNVTDIANPENLAINENISEEETQAITDYINRVCNVIFERLPEFNNINDADKEWIYLHLTIEKDDGFATEEEINNDLQSFLVKN